MSIEVISHTADEMIANVADIIDPTGEHPIKSTNLHRQHQTGEIETDEGVVYSIVSIPVTGDNGPLVGREIHVLETRPDGRTERVEIVSSANPDNVPPRIVYIENSSLVRDPDEAIAASRDLIGRVAKLNGNVMRVTNHRGELPSASKPSTGGATSDWSARQLQEREAAMGKTGSTSWSLHMHRVAADGLNGPRAGTLFEPAPSITVSRAGSRLERILDRQEKAHQTRGKKAEAAYQQQLSLKPGKN